MLNQVIVNLKTREKRFAYLMDGKVAQIYVQQPQYKTTVGNIYLGQVTKVIPGMNAAFVEIGEGKGAYLPREKMISFVRSEGTLEEKKKKSVSSYIKQGERVLVQVIKDAAGPKGAKITGIIEMSGEHLVYMPYGRYVAVSKKINTIASQKNLRSFGERIKTKSEGLIFRTSAANCSEADLIDELETLRQQYKELEQQDRKKKIMLLHENNEFNKQLFYLFKQMKEGEVIVDRVEERKQWQAQFPHLTVSFHQGNEDLFSHYHLEAEIEKALKRIVWLSNGSYLIFDQAEAATIIDVNTGKYEGKHQLEQTVFQTNILAAKEAARQIRLRDISGIILIDFIDMKDAEEKQLLDVMLKELKGDNRQSKVVGFTELGILQLTRKKTMKSLSEMTQRKCVICEGTGVVKSAESMAFQLERELWEYRNKDIDLVEIHATEDVNRIFIGEGNIHKKRLEEVLGFTIKIDIVDFPKPDYFIRMVK
ncbi:Rne/Rng family ribonuclease [Niallia sp.]|uniref:Rne/Rng family ribonuclease n=1 Tax=Niallia sp. TaxID=2837523 RepID=UPI00289D1E62|nr:Rne/Rng family ribonuclease [Niallia sp.]